LELDENFAGRAQVEEQEARMEGDDFDEDSDDDSPGGGGIARLNHIGPSTIIGIKRLSHLDTESLEAEIAASSGGILRRISTAAAAAVTSVFSPKSSRHPRALQPRAAPAPAAMNYPPAGGWREHAGMTPLFRLENTGAAPFNLYFIFLF